MIAADSPSRREVCRRRQNLFATTSYCPARAARIAAALVAVFLLAPTSFAQDDEVAGANIAKGCEALNAALVKIVKGSGPAVVSISTTKFEFGPASPGESTLPSNSADNFSHTPDENPEQQDPMRKTGIGSGTIIEIGGRNYVLTNHHVVFGVDRITIQLQDRREYEAHVKGWDPKVDIAVLEVPGAQDLPAVPVGDSDEVQVGELVLAIGSPFGLPHTITIGVVSAVRRYGQGIEEYEDFIQTDAAINRGNSGGPLLNLKGEVVGLNTAIRTTHMGGNIGIGFAIPMSMIMPVARQLVDTGHVARGWLGVSVQNMTPELADAFGMPQSSGVVVTKIVPGTPAEAGGLHQGDVIVKIEGTPIDNANQLRNYIAATMPSSSVRMDVARGDRNVRLSVAIGEKPYAADEFRPPARKQPSGIGLSLQDVSRDVAAALGLKGTGGALVTDVEVGSLSGHARPVPLVRGDVILEADGQPVASAATLKERLSRMEPGTTVLMLIFRRGNELYTVMKTPSGRDAEADLGN